MTDSPAEARDYRGTVFLPKTAFPMRGDLPKREPAMLERWARLGLWERLRAQSKGRDTFVLHDGPPYANGNLHIGHALNKILKDVINRAAQMAGHDANYVPGWDCHGLPIEWKVEEEYRSKGRDKDAVPVLDFRAECRAYAAALARRAVGRIPAPRRRRRLGRPLRDDGLPLRGDHRRRDRQVPAERLAVSRPAAGDVVARSRRPRWPRPRSNTTTMSARRCTRKFRLLKAAARRTWSAPMW